jgi:hypothetical protein
MVRNTAPEPRACWKALTRKACHAGYFEGEVHLEVLLQLLALVVIHDVVNESMDFPVIQGGQIDLANLPINPDHRGDPGREV